MVSALWGNLAPEAVPLKTTQISKFLNVVVDNFDPSHDRCHTPAPSGVHGAPAPARPVRGRSRHRIESPTARAAFGSNQWSRSASFRAPLRTGSATVAQTATESRVASRGRMRGSGRVGERGPAQRLPGGVMSGGVGAPNRTAPCGGHSPLRSSGGSVHHEIASCTAQFETSHRIACSDATSSGRASTGQLGPVSARGSSWRRASYRRPSAVGSARTSAPTSVVHHAETGRTRTLGKRSHMRSHKRSGNRRGTALRTVADRHRRQRLGKVIHNHVEIFFHVRSVLPH